MSEKPPFGRFAHHLVHPPDSDEPDPDIQWFGALA